MPPPQPSPAGGGGSKPPPLRSGGGLGWGRGCPDLVMFTAGVGVREDRWRRKPSPTQRDYRSDSKIVTLAMPPPSHIVSNP